MSLVNFCLDNDNTVHMKQLLLLIPLLFAPPAIAEIYNCNGVWTDKPCSSQSANQPKVVPSAPSPTPTTVSVSDERNETFAERRKLFTDADLEAFRARRDGKGNIRLDEARDVCLAPKGDLATCRQMVFAILEKIQLLSAKPTAAPVGNTENSNNNTQVIVINENTDIKINNKDNRYPNRNDHHQRPKEIGTPTLIPLYSTPAKGNPISRGGGMPPLMKP